MSHLKNSPPSDTSAYLVKYRREAQKCINNGSLEDLVYASYVVAIYSIIGGESVQLAIKCCREFCKSFAELARVRKTTDDWMELLWREVLLSLYCVHRDAVLFNTPNTPAASLESVKQWETLLETSSGLLASQEDIANLPLSMTTERICHKVLSLSVYMHIYLDQFLQRVIVAENAEETNVTKEHLCSIVDRIMQLVSHLSNISDYIYHAYQIETNSRHVNNFAENTFLHFPPVQPRGLQAAGDPRIRDTALALLYAFARLLKSMLEPTSTGDQEQLISEAHRSAIAICRLCANIPIDRARETLLVKRSLFWAGLLLTESTLPSGQKFDIPLLTRVAHVWIKNRLRQCILSGHHWRTFSLFDDEEVLLDEFFRKADRCMLVEGIWRVGAGNVSLFYYTNTLAPWFSLGLHLVRFEHKPHTIGRSLEIA